MSSPPVQYLSNPPHAPGLEGARPGVGTACAPGAETPAARLEQAYHDFCAQLGATLVRHVTSCPPDVFAKLVVDLLLAMGYGGSRPEVLQAVTPTDGGGIEGLISDDRLGFAAIYLQAKQQPPELLVEYLDVVSFVGSLVSRSANKGVLITTARFSEEAKEFVKRIPQKVALIDGERLAELMMDFGIGVASVAKYEVQRLDASYFE